jgi:hypothetical protein
MRRSYQYCYLILLFILLSANVSLAQTAQTELSLSFTAAKKEFILLEPISVKLKLNINQQQPKLVKERDKKWLVYLRVQFLDPSTTVAWQAGITRLIDRIASYDIEQGELQIQDLFLQEYLRIARPGTYRLTLTVCDDRNQRLASETLQFNVLEPKGIDQQAYQWLKNFQTGNDPLNGAYLSESVNLSDGLRVFVDSFRDTPYGDFTAFQLANIYYRKENFELALPILLELSRQDDFGFHEDVLACLASIYWQIGETGKARYYQSILLERYPGSEFLAKTAELLDEVGKDK